jgi:hypothetical protein
MQSLYIKAALLGAGLIITLPMTFTTALAASHCKGLAETACASDSSCRWVAGYERKDGRQVAAHCRLGSPTKAGKDSKTDAPKISAVK